VEPLLGPVERHFVAVGLEAAFTPHTPTRQLLHLSPTAGAYRRV